MKNSVSLMGGRIFHAALNLFAVGLIARYLKLEKFGEYGFITAVCTVLMVITDMGINRIAIREISKDTSRANDILWASSFIKCLLSAVTFACIALTINIISDNREVITATYICGLAVIVFFLGDIFIAIFIAFERMIYASILNSVQITTYLLFTVLFIRLDYGLNGIFGALLLSYLARIFSGILLTFKSFFKPHLRLDFSLCRYLIKEGFPIGIQRILRKTSYRIDTILIKMMRPVAEVGIYHGAYRVILVLALIPESITDALFPMISRLATESRDTLGTLLEKTFKSLLIIVIPLVATLMYFSKEIIHLILGDAFMQAVPALMIFSFVWGIMFFEALFERFLHASNRQVLATKAAAICLIVNILLDLVLIYSFGYFGAVIATLLAEVSFFLVAYLFISKTMGIISWRKVLLKPLLATLPMAAILFFMGRVSPLLAMPAGLFVYLLGLAILKTFEPDEIEMFKEIFRRILGYMDLKRGKLYQKR
jgi:O-antigen/teichoic acid export membrane protein